jgi:hypothetical protein
LPFQQLRMVFVKNWKAWVGTAREFCNGKPVAWNKAKFKHDMQHSNKDGRTWESYCVFVPAILVMKEISDLMRVR